ncbi:hypothetical protein RE6C_03718 [Rhodopirellula europaea 6C]|uniref:Uncharacterized protein n=1 Tax=Rhodopirellula europaea 6C TaxID=1263867 RepID=M2B082_9BACT|nr:hypothetical protein RE6C_03718 [Rhodopirellula europaea 6C]
MLGGQSCRWWSALIESSVTSQIAEFQKSLQVFPKAMKTRLKEIDCLRRTSLEIRLGN